MTLKEAWEVVTPDIQVGDVVQHMNCTEESACSVMAMERDIAHLLSHKNANGVCSCTKRVAVLTFIRRPERYVRKGVRFERLAKFVVIPDLGDHTSKEERDSYYNLAHKDKHDKRYTITVEEE